MDVIVGCGSYTILKYQDGILCGSLGLDMTVSLVPYIGPVMTKTEDLNLLESSVAISSATPTP